MVKDINPGSGGSLCICEDLVLLNGALYFAADDGTSGMELWKSDGTAAGTVPVKDIDPGSAASGPYDLLNANGALVFGANDGTIGTEPWQSDGTPGGTIPLGNLYPGPGPSNPDNFTVAGGHLFFAATPADKGHELFAVAALPTAVTVASFGAKRSGSGVVLHWRTTSEAGMLGYDVYRERVLLTRTMIPATGGLGGRGYVLGDARPGTKPQYTLVVVRADGSRRRYGPVTPP
jgi:ELWxxDGT repeat protein